MQVLIDSSKRHFRTIATTVTIAAMAAVWTTFIRPGLVMASDLQSVVESVDRLEMKVDGNQKVIKMLALSVVESRIDYLQDNIRTLETRKKFSPLTADEEYRLSRHKDDLEKEVIKRDKYLREPH